MSFHAGTRGVDGSQQLLSVQAFSAAATELKNEVLEKEREYLLNFEKLGEIVVCSSREVAEILALSSVWAGGPASPLPVMPRDGWWT